MMESDGAAGAAAETDFVARLKAGDDDAFADLVATHTARMLAAATRLLRQASDAQDAVQEAFLSAFKALDDFDGRACLGTWLHRITVNACLMRLRSRARRPEVAIEDLLPMGVSGSDRNALTSGRVPPSV